MTLASHIWTRVPGFDEWGVRRGWLRLGPVARYIKVQRSACRCGAWCSVRFPMAGSRRSPSTQVVEPSETKFRLEWQDGVCCGPPQGQGQ